MTTGEIVACLGLGVGLLAHAWRGGGVSSAIAAAVHTLTTRADRLEEKAELADEVPELRRRVTQLEALLFQQEQTISKSIRPGLVRVEEHVKAVDQRVSSIKSMPAVRPPARSWRSGDDE